MQLWLNLQKRNRSWWQRHFFANNNFRSAENIFRHASAFKTFLKSMCVQFMFYFIAIVNAHQRVTFMTSEIYVSVVLRNKLGKIG